MSSDPIEITKGEFFGLNHYRYGEAYFGSCRGMRYRLAAEPLKRLRPDEEVPEDMKLIATVWPEPWAYGRTPAEEMTSETFTFSEEGLDCAVNWFKGRLEAERERWEAAGGLEDTRES